MSDTPEPSIASPAVRRPGILGRPRLMLAGLLLVGFVGHVLYLAFSPPLGLAGDEAHYWDWSRQLDWSYYSKGPAVAVLIRGGRLLFGDTPLGVRFPALVLAVGTSLCTYWLTNRVFKSERLALGAVALTHVVPMFVAGSMLMTIDAPYYFCWATATCFGYRAAVEGKRRAWPLAGVFIGLGFLAKYAALLWLLNLLIYLAIANRRALRSPWPWLTCVIALLFTTPILIWNARHDWVSFGHVARSTSENQNHFNVLKILGQFGELSGGQVALLNPIVAAFMIGGVWWAIREIRSSKRRVGESASREEGETVRPFHDSPTHRLTALTYLLAIGLPFFGYVSLVTLFKNTEPNWPAPTYFTLIPLAAWFVARTWPKPRGWLIGAAAIGFVAMVVIHEPTWFVRSKPLAKAAARLIGYDDVGRAVSDELKTLSPGAFVLCDKYQLAGLMAFYVDGHPKTYCLGSYIADPKERDRLTQYDIWPDRDLSQPALRGRDAVFVGHVPPDLSKAFARIEQIPAIPVVRRGVTLRNQSVWRCYDFQGMTRPDDGLTKR